VPQEPLSRGVRAAAMRFPLADWIEAHSDCRHNLGQSGMRGAVVRPALSAEEARETDAGELTGELARSLGVSPQRISLTHGATEANAWVALYLGRTSRPRPGRCRVGFPEYPSLYEIARWAGFRIEDRAGAADLAVVSRPRNPEGDLWAPDRLLEWADGARHLLVDETFREFARVPSVATLGQARLWTTGSLTKFYAGDDLRVGFVVAPEESADAFARFVGLASDEIADACVAGAIATLRHRREIQRDVFAILDRNRAALRAALPGIPTPASPVCFDRVDGQSGDGIAHRALAASVLVCPGSFFGDPAGVRIGLTRATFPADLRAYLAVRDGRPGRPAASAPRRRTGVARPRPGARARARAARS
jgi:histidinol-phosphate/aromatic aminotransferase/cobyric acid decarboxylase-like protein